MNAPRLKITVSLVLLFALGAATGVVGARKLTPPSAPAPAHVPVEQRWSNARFEECRTRLHLTPAQVAVIAPHFRQFGQEMRQVREELRGKYATALRSLNENIARDLTPEQRKELWTLVQERWQRRENEQRNP